MNGVIQVKSFSEIDLSDPFFDSLKADYQGFTQWFNKKSKKGENAYVLIDKGIQAFLYLKSEEGTIDDVTPVLKSGIRVKIGTMKVNPHGTRLGERFIKKAFDYALAKSISELYVTVFPKHTYLINLYKKYGFYQYGKKVTNDGEELVFVKSLNSRIGDVLLDYPEVYYRDRKKYLLSIYPAFHTRLFPDSKLNNEDFNMIEDVSHTNSIHKVYLCRMRGVENLQRGDVLVIYRTSDNLGPARYRSVATSVCVVEDLKDIQQFKNVEEYLEYCKHYSVYSKDELTRWYKSRKVKHVIKMTYNIALRRRITRKALIEKVGLEGNEYWGFMELANSQFEQITKLGGIYESLAINTTGVC